MFTISIIIALGSAILLFLLSLLLRNSVLKQPDGNKKTIDNVKLIAKEVKKTVGEKNSALSAICAPVFVLILYFLHWEIALGFAVGVLATILVNFVLSDMIVRNTGRVVEASRKSLPTTANLSFKSGTALALLVCGLAVLITAVFFEIFRNTESLIGLAVGVSLVALFLNLSGKISKDPVININPLIGFFELIVLSTSITMLLGSLMFSSSNNPTLFPLVLTSASVVIFALTSFLIRFFKNTKNIAAIFYRTIAINFVLFITAAFFIFEWMMRGVGIKSMLNFYGLAIASLILLCLAGYSILINIYNQVIKTASFVAEKSELPIEAKSRLSEMGIYEKISSQVSKLYSIKGTAFISIAIFAGYRMAISRSGIVSLFDLGNYLVLIGLFLGMIVISLYYLQKNKFKIETTNKTILLSVLILIIPVVIGLTLGTVALGAYVIGIVLTGLFASLFCSESFSNIIRISAIIALLIASSIVK